MWATGLQLDQSYAAVWSFEEFANFWDLVVSSIVPDDIDDASEGITRIKLGEKLRRADPVHGGRLDKGRIEGFQVESAMDVHAHTPEYAYPGFCSFYSNC